MAGTRRVRYLLKRAARKTLPVKDHAPWDLVAEEWLEQDVDRLWRRHADHVNRQLVESWWPQHARRVLKTDLFDEIAGEGLATALAARSEHAAGMDISGRIVSAACRQGLDGAVADVRRLPFATASFDVVVSNSTLDHFETTNEIDRAFREIHRVLRVGGTLILTLDNPTNPVVGLRNALPMGALRWAGLVPYPIGATLRRSELKRRLRSAKFDVRATAALLHCPRVWSVWRSRTMARRSSADQTRFLANLERWEGLARWPTRFLTGHLVAACAVRR